MFGNVPEVNVTEVPEGGYLLDVRENDEWAAGHAPTAVHIPLGELNTRAGEIPRDVRVYVVCRAGGRSAQAVAALNNAGWETVNIAGGMQAWELTGLDMETSSDAEPRVI
ncbi:rhodanese-like domain-containing protein [Nocardiopsis sp. N85]|uniref:rhodanese-like domain-containing protein n=1 Tax=Nocardiopsis sp. N85 TaxID=3029400 RepID=UPI00237FC195|nr:rhodanese-like domain-containing protein [Nocardiopsis sp. N85]MDE3724460.1 rhodanese-like domain-containing protein [Nocardiopsis sp. N85]